MVKDMRELNTLPQDVQDKVKSVLKAYDEVNVIFEYGEYNVSASICIKCNYASDHEFVGTYKAEDVFTPDERIINYVECFRDYPIEYKGKRDYRWINNLENGCKIKFDEDRNLITV